MSQQCSVGSMQVLALTDELRVALTENAFSRVEGLWQRAQQWGVSNATVRGPTRTSVPNRTHSVHWCAFGWVASCRAV